MKRAAQCAFVCACVCTISEYYFHISLSDSSYRITLNSENIFEKLMKYENTHTHTHHHHHHKIYQMPNKIKSN